MGNNTGIEVPEDVVTALGAGKRPAVVVNVNGFEYRSTVAVMGGKYLLPFSAERRRESGISGGDPIDVELTPDTAPRTVEVPEDLHAALDARPGAVGGVGEAVAQRPKGSCHVGARRQGRSDPDPPHRRHRREARRVSSGLIGALVREGNSRRTSSVFLTTVPSAY